ncbi:MAG: hypothetical protein QOD14_2418 [Solirubrobacterales bacterium]|nr:hypothetical protein [Solirubrobacterales bacterium]
MINSFRSERGWQGRRRIAVLVSLAGVLGVAFLGTAGTASAATVANCNAKLEPKGKSKAGTQAKLSFVCDGPVRTYGVGSNKPIKNYGTPSAGAASSFLSCEGTGVGFGCGVSDRAAPGTQTPGTTGWDATLTLPAGGSNATDTPTTCNGYKRTQGGGTGVNGPNLNTIVTGPCTQLIPAGTKVTQTLKLGSSPCSGGSKNPTQLNLMVGGEPAVTAVIAPVSGNSDPTKNGPGGESTTPGEYLQAPIPVSLKAYKRCQSSGKSGGAKKSSAPATKYPVSCTGSVSPATTPGDSSLSFTCNQNVRAFALYSNKSIALPGDEPVITGTAGGGNNEGALAQCEGTIPGPGYGCGVTDRQVQTSSLPNGQAITAGNTATQNMGFEFNPCQKPGQPKTKVWLVVMGEPIIGSTVGEFTSAPQQLAVAYGKCKGGEKK